MRGGRSFLERNKETAARLDPRPKQQDILGIALGKSMAHGLQVPSASSPALGTPARHRRSARDVASMRIEALRAASAPYDREATEPARACAKMEGRRRPHRRATDPRGVDPGRAA